MPGVLDRLAQQATRDENQNLARAANDAQWANTFNSVQSDDKLRANLNLDEMIARTSQRKMEMEAQANLANGLAYARMKEVEARTKAANDMAPLNVQRRQAQVESEITRDKAMARTDAFKARAAEQEAQDMEIFHAGMEDGLRSGIRIGTPEYADLAAKMRLKAPAMKSEYFDDMWKATANSPLTPEQAIQKVRDTEAARAEVRQSFAKTPAQIEEESAARARGTASVKPEKDVVLPSLEKERAMHAKMLDRAKRIRSKAVDTAIIADADADILESEKALSDIESQIRTHREGGSAPASTAAPVKVASAPAAAHPMEAQLVRQKSTGKMGRIINGQFVAE